MKFPIVLWGVFAATSAYFASAFLAPGDLVVATSVDPEPRPIGAPILSDDGHYVALPREDRSIEIRDIHDRVLGVVRGHNAPVIGLRFTTPSGSPTIVTVDEAGELIETNLNSLGVREIAQGSALEAGIRPARAELGTFTRTVVDASWWLSTAGSTNRAKVEGTQAPVLARGAQPPVLGMFRDCDVCPEMIRLDGPDDHGAHPSPAGSVTVNISRPGEGLAAIGRFPIDEREWASCIADRACDVLPGTSETAGRAATGMTWDQAATYANWLALRTGRAYRIASLEDWDIAINVAQDLEASEDPARTQTDHHLREVGIFPRPGAEAEWTSECAVKGPLRCASYFIRRFVGDSAPERLVAQRDVGSPSRGLRVAFSNE